MRRTSPPETHVGNESARRRPSEVRQLDVRSGEPGITTFDIESATRSADGRTVRLRIPGMTPAMQMHLDWRLAFEGIGEQASFVHFTVHRLADDAGS